MLQQGQGDWLGIAANLIASTVECADYALPGIIERIVGEVPEFSTGHAEFSKVDEDETSRDLAYAAQDFAICHEVGHVAARDFSDPDEVRADRWGVAAYFGSWGHRLPLHMAIVRSDPLRASIGPFAFSCALRSMLAARVLISQRLGDESGKSKRQIQTYRAVMARSHSLLAETDARTAQFVRDPNDVGFRIEQARVLALFDALARYEKAFGASLASLSQATCAKALAAARS